MKSLSKLTLLFLLLTATVLSAKDKLNPGFSLYKGGWFEIEYPSDFTVKPSIPSNTPKAFDSAYFISPDKKVKFYVFSPQWSGDASDIAFNAEKEIEKDKRTETKNGAKTKWYTYEARDGSYSRSYQESVNAEETTKLIIGIEYSGRDSYKKYKDQYLKFKKSIVQFAD